MQPTTHYTIISVHPPCQKCPHHHHTNNNNKRRIIQASRIVVSPCLLRFNKTNSTQTTKKTKYNSRFKCVVVVFFILFMSLYLKQKMHLLSRGFYIFLRFNIYFFLRWAVSRLGIGGCNWQVSACKPRLVHDKSSSTPNQKWKSWRGKSRFSIFIFIQLLCVCVCVCRFIIKSPSFHRRRVRAQGLNTSNGWWTMSLLIQ